MPKIKQGKLTIKTNERLSLDYGHKLRGFFANQFDNILFHHHEKENDYKYNYPLIQYKILRGYPTVIALKEAVTLIANNFLEIEKLTLEDKVFTAPIMEFQVSKWNLSVNEEELMLPYKYEFITPWMGLNQRNYDKYKAEITGSSDEERVDFLSSILIGNILSFAKGIDWWVDGEIKVIPVLKEITVNFKDNKMIGFKGFFFSNIKLPDYIGLGQATSRGFGTIQGNKEY